MSRQPFITDMGSSLELTADNGPSMTLGRFGVWTWSASREKYQVEETSDDLAYLQKKYGPGLPVHQLKPEKP